MQRPHYSTIDEYIGDFPEEVQAKLENLRQTIGKAAPGAEEVISYQMPAFKLHGILVYFAAFKNHIGFFPTSTGIEAFKKELSAYETSKGTVRLSIDRPLPLALIGRIVRYRVKENLERKAKKAKKENRYGKAGRV